MPLNVDLLNTGKITIDQSEITPQTVYLKPNDSFILDTSQITFDTGEFLVLGNPGGSKNSNYLQRANFIRLDVNINESNSRFVLDESSEWRVDNSNTSNESRITLTPTEISIKTIALFLPDIPTYVDNSAAVSDGYPTNGVYKTPTGEIRIVI